ncbi:MAG: T9SS type A sorting domain-containing protein [Bacteroidota bacterium]
MKRLLPISLFTLFLFSTISLSAQELISAQRVITLPRSNFSIILGSAAKYSVEAYRVTYTTPDVNGVTDTASGLITIPVANGAINSPTVLVQHGTVASRDAVPSNLQGGYELGAFFSTVGYTTVQPDYLGLGDSRGFHPYVHAATEASAGVDMILAAQTFFEQQGVPVNDQLFVTGYSQGGHAAMAAHQLLQESYSEDLPVVASAPLSGPYSISTATVDGLLTDDPYNFPGYAAWTLMGYNQIYNLYDSLEQYMVQPYADMALQFFTDSIELGTLHQMMIDSLTAQQGAPIIRFMFQDSIIDQVTNNPNHPLNVALRDNDTYLWAPTSPTRLYYCMADDQVTFTNSVFADSVMNELGAADLDAIDVNSTADHGGCVLPAGLATITFFNQFADFTVTSTRNLPELQGVIAYPNPAIDQVQLLGVPDESLLNIFDANGRLIRQENLTSSTPNISVAQLPQGVYLFRLVAEKGVWNQQIIVR